MVEIQLKIKVDTFFFNKCDHRIYPLPIILYLYSHIQNNDKAVNIYYKYLYKIKGLFDKADKLSWAASKARINRTKNVAYVN